MSDPLKTRIIDCLRAFVRQRPGIEPRNYGDWRSYRTESASVTRDLHDAETLIRAIEWRDSISGAELLAAFRAFSGRLSCTVTDGDKGPRVTLSYCTGQYFPTEYRRAAAGVCAAALWDWMRGKCMPAPDSWRVESYGTWNGNAFTRDQSKPMQLHAALAESERKGKGYFVQAYHGGKAPGDWLRASFRREFGRRLASRYFN